MFWQRLAQNRLLDIALVVLAAIVVGKLLCVLPSRATQNDFAHYYASSRLLAAGRRPYGVPLAPTLERFGFTDLEEDVPMATNPPLLLWLFVPFALLPPKAAFAGWVIVECVCLVTLLRLTRRLVGQHLSARTWRLIVAGTIASPAVYWHFYYSQVQLLVAVIVLQAFVWHVERKHTAACLAVAAAGLLKLFPFVLLPWLLWRGSRTGRALIRRSSITLSFIAAAIGISGPALWIDFFVHARAVLADWATCGLLNYTVPSLVLNSGRILMLVTSSPWIEPAAWPAGVAAGLALIGWAYLQCFRGSGEQDLEFCLLCLAMLVGNVTAWVHYQVLLVFPIALAAARVAARPRRQDVLLLGVALFLLLMHGNAASWRDLHPYLGIWLSYCPLYGIMILAWFFAGQLSGPRAVMVPAPSGGPARWVRAQPSDAGL